MHRIIDTRYGEVMLKQFFDCDKTGINLYIGDNFDQCIGEFDCIDLNSPEEELENYICQCIEQENNRYYQ